MADKSPEELLAREGAEAFKREQSFASEEARAAWFSKWDSVPLEKRIDIIQEYQLAALTGRTQDQIEAIRKGIEDRVVQRAMSRFGVKYTPSVRRDLEESIRNTSTAMLNKLLEQEVKRAAGDKKSEAARDAGQKSAEKYAEAQGMIWTPGAKAEIQTKASYRPDPESFKPFSPEDVAAYTSKLDALKRKLEVTQLADKIREMRWAGKQEELSSMLAQQLGIRERQLGVSADTRLGASEKIRNEITLTQDALKRGGVGGFKVSIPAKKPMVVGLKSVRTVDVKDEEGRKIGRQTIVEEEIGMASPILPEGGGRGSESADARAFAQRVRNQLVEDQIMMILGLQDLNIEDLKATKEGQAQLNRLRRRVSEELAPEIRAGTKGGAAVAKASIYSEKAERTAINAGKEFAKEKMGKEAWSALSTEQKEQAGAEYADRFYKPYTIRVGPTGKSEDGTEFARPDPQASTLLNQKPQLFTPSGFGMKMRSAAGADKRVARDLPNDAYADAGLYKTLLPRLGKRKAINEAKYLNPRWIAAAFGNDVLEAVKQRKAAQTSGFNITTQITVRDLEAAGFKMSEPKYSIVSPIVPTLFGQAMKEWHLAHMQREVDPTLARQVYSNGKLIDVGSKAGKRELFMRGARATLYGAKAGGEKRIINEARKLAQEEMDESALYIGDSDEAKAIYDAKLEELTELAADIILSKEPVVTKSYNDKIRAFNARLRDKSVRTVEEKTKAVRGKRLAKATPENKIEVLAEDAVFDRYSKVAHQMAGAEPKRENWRSEDGFLAARANWVKRYDEAFNRAAVNLDEDLAEAKTAIRSGARNVASGTVILRKKKDGEGQVSGLGAGFGSYDLGSKIAITAVGGLVVYSLFKALTSKGNQS